MRYCLAYVFIVIIAACKQSATVFEKISSSRSGLRFNNKITENDSINPLDLEFLYNGGGVAVGDFNRDGLRDLYFTASMLPNKLYLNKGNLEFADITSAAGCDGAGSWSSGAAVTDINQDGWPDLYLCTTIKSDPRQRKNLLYINKGLNKDSVPVFEEMAEAYGLADTSYSVHAAFFDYDNDGDLDLYLLTTKLAKRESTSFSSNQAYTDSSDVDKLFRNDWDEEKQHPVYTNVSKAAGIIHNGYGLGLSITDINRDGWPDVYVANDFFGSDLLYLNNRNGSFSEVGQSCFKHSSQNAMGTDVADVNNDGLADVFTVDMNPEDNFRKKKNMSSNNYFLYQKQQYEKIMLQYVRNTFQLNRGLVPLPGDTAFAPVFSDISFYTGTAETDWSWSVLLSDGNNDGRRDIFITNGYPRDVTDHDFAAFRKQQDKKVNKQALIDQIPQVKLPNYAYENKGDLRFENSTVKWGMGQSTFSNGAALVDLDNDGDLEYVINNINDEVLLYKNNTRETNERSGNYINISFSGSALNKKGIGAVVELYYGNGHRQMAENNCSRGYLSSADDRLFFGLDTITRMDSVIVYWPGLLRQKITDVAANQQLNVAIANAVAYVPSLPYQTDRFFTDVSKLQQPGYLHNEMDFIDFDRERLLPHKLSQYGPGLAVSDINGDGLDDLFAGASAGNLGQFMVQQPNGTFKTEALPTPKVKDARLPENMGLLLFDADGDGDDDLYCASGSNEFPAGTKNYQDQFYLNDGRGHFSFDSSSAFPINYTSKSCVKAADYDNDGDLDLFLGGRLLPGKYPYPVSSFIYRNDTRNGTVKFSDVTKELAPALTEIGMVCDALWTDIDNDRYMDLVLVGEWMPITVLKNRKGRLVNITDSTGLAAFKGSWNSLAAGDFNNDGLVDYVAGNIGQNSFYRASDQYPVNVYADDFDKNGTTELIVTVFIPGEKGTRAEFPAFNRDDIVSQMPALKKKFLTYKDFGAADINALFTKEQLQHALTRSFNTSSSSVLINKGGAKFTIAPLPPMAQLAPVFGIATEDIDGDGNLDILLAGNDFGNEVSNGRYDAFNGLLLTGDGKGQFRSVELSTSGLFIPGDGKALVKLKGPNNTMLVAASENRGPLRMFQNNYHHLQWLKPAKGDIYFLIALKNGQVRKEEIYYGHSFLSQSTRWTAINESVQSVTVVDERSNKRVLYEAVKQE